MRTHNERKCQKLIINIEKDITYEDTERKEVAKANSLVFSAL